MAKLDLSDLSEPNKKLDLSDLSKPIADTQSAQSGQSDALRLSLGIDRTPVDTLRDVASGMAKGGENIARLAFGDNAAAPANIASDNPNPLAVGIGQNLPALVSGGTSLLGQALSQGLYGMTQASPNEKNAFGLLPSGRIGAGIEDALITMLGGKAIQSIPEIAKTVKNTLAPGSLSDSIMNKLSGGKSLETHAIEFAGKIKNTFQDVKKGLSDRYDKFFNKEIEGNKLGDIELYPERDRFIQGGRAKVGEERYTRDMPDFPSGDNSAEYKKALDDFKSNPTLKNGHLLQSELAGDERSLESQIKAAKREGQPTKQLYDDLKKTRDSRKSLQQKIHEKSGNYADEYKEITNDYLKNVIPYYGDTNLRKIIFGDLTNPRKEAISGIFKNADNDTKTILSHLGKDAENDVLFQAIGHDPDEIDSKTLASRLKTLNRSGFEHYTKGSNYKDIKSLQDAISIKKYTPRIIGSGLLGDYIFNRLKGNK